MSRINSKAKGAGGEREFCDYLFERFKLEVKPERNLEQVRNGGADIICQPFAFEIKRCESLKFHDWWTQVKSATTDEKGLAFGLIPVVAFRQNNRPWEFLISASHINVDFGFIHIVSEYVFADWVKKQIDLHKNRFNKELPESYVDALLTLKSRHLDY